MDVETPFSTIARYLRCIFLIEKLRLARAYRWNYAIYGQKPPEALYGQTLIDLAEPRCKVVRSDRSLLWLR